jgi:hypothetical protein
MTMNSNTTEGGAEGREDGYTHTLWIDYRAAYYEGNKHVDNPPSDAVADGRLFAAAEALKHAEALFRLLTLVSTDALERLGPTEAALMFENVGELGARIVGAAYGHVEEARRTLPV